MEGEEVKPGSAIAILSFLMTYPSDEFRERVVSMASSSLLSRSLLGMLGEGLVGKLREELLSLSREEELMRARREYTRLFISSLGGTPCPPYESVQRTGRREVLREAGYLLEMMRRWGVRVKESFEDLPEHIAAELSFLSFLITTAESGEGEEAERAREDLRTILSRMLEWVGSLRECVERESEGRLYPLILRAVEETLKREALRWGIPTRSS